ncbi:MAG: phosphatidate cytidylyltransferase [Oscillospiraceae bacterium]|nr:phosphatidate cytidylyltransferase [Oscillospiraceae bacterium]
MRVRIITGIAAVPLLVAALVLTPSFVTAIIIAIIVAVSAWELSGAMGIPKSVGVRVLLAATSGWFAIVFPDNAVSLRDIWAMLFLFLLLTVLFAVEMSGYERRPGKRGMKIFGVGLAGDQGVALFILPIFLASMTWLRSAQHGRLLVLLPLASVFLTDAGAYFTGIFFGKHKVFPRISPNKTAEGCIGGIFIGTAAVMAYGAIAAAIAGTGVSIASLAVVGIAGAAAAEFGDLTFSYIKRLHGIKDYGKLLPGHGGMLDRFDSLVFCAPTVLILSTWLPVFGNTL